MGSAPSLIVKGLQDYEPCLIGMRERVNQLVAQKDEATNEIWLLEHSPIFTLGQAGKPEHVLAPGSIPVVRTERGGQVTYHGPGQAVVYPLLHLRYYRLNVRCYVNLLEQCAIDVLANHGIAAQRKAGAPGVYVSQTGAKIAALGVKISRGMAFHGLALNVAMDLEPFSRINPCGYEGLAVTDMQSLQNTAQNTPARLSFPAVQQELGHTLVSLLTKFAACGNPSPT